MGLTNMIADRPDWGITRQRYWGVPLCFVQHKETGELHPDILNIMDKAAAVIAKDGIEAWFTLALTDLIPAADCDTYEKLNDVLDVWFDSGTTPYCASAPTSATPPTSTSKAATSTAAGSTPRCSPAAPSTATRPTKACSLTASPLTKAAAK